MVVSAGCFTLTVVTSVQSNGHKAVQPKACTCHSLWRCLVLCKRARSSARLQARRLPPQPISPRVHRWTLPRAACWLEPPQIPWTQFLWVTSLFCRLTARLQSGSSVFLISLLFTRLIQHHLSWPSKLRKADRRPPPSAGPHSQIPLWVRFSLLGLSVSSL